LAADRIKKKQIKQDSFVTATVRAWEYVREHQNTVFILFIVLIIVIAGAVWMNQSRRQSKEMTEQRFGEALSYLRLGAVPSAEQTFKLIHEGSPRSREGVYSLYFAAKCALIEGRSLEAIEAFDSYLEAGTQFSLFRDAAVAGKATALENERRYEEAAELYLGLAEHPTRNAFYKKEYLQGAAENFKKGHNADRALRVMEQLLDLTTGVERRDLEIEIAMLRG
jgi:tetratricopeptide (TPR) repeat protein